jgi:hypothetical protein
VAQGVGPEFKPQYCKTKTKKQDKTTKKLFITHPTFSPSSDM